MTRRLLVAVVSLLALAGGCGLSEDDSPQAIAPENVPPDLLDPNPDTSTTIPQATGTDPINVYFIEEVGDEVRLSEVERQVADGDDPGDRIVALLAQPTEEEAAAGLTTTIPADTMLAAEPVLNVATSELVIDLSGEFLSIEGPEVAKAFAQIVWTVSAPYAEQERQVRRVSFLVEGEEIRAQNAEGAEQDGAVRRGDYLALSPR